jgi:hypothetical protein
VRIGYKVTAQVIGLIVVGALFIIAPYIGDKLSTSIPAATGTEALAIQGNATSNMMAGLSMGSITPLLQGVGIVLMVLGGFMGQRATR